jgi:energy-converting hydrogenase B subunit E
MTLLNIQTASFLGAISLVLIGLAAILFIDNLIKKVLGMMFLTDGVNLFLVTLGFRLDGGTIAPIFTEAFYEAQNSSMSTAAAEFSSQAGFCLPYALVLTNIVIGAATMAVVLGLTIKMYQKHKSLNASEVLGEGGPVG